MPWIHGSLLPKKKKSDKNEEVDVQSIPFGVGSTRAAGGKKNKKEKTATSKKAEKAESENGKTAAKPARKGGKAPARAPKSEAAAAAEAPVVASS